MRAQISSVFETTSNVNNGIIVIDGGMQTHKDGRRIGDPVVVQNTMTTHHCGSRALHKMRGRENFKTEEMLDAHGNSAPTGKIEMASVWQKDGPNEFYVNLSGEDFWFRNGAICERFCEEKRINPKFWKRTDEAQKCKL